VVVVSRGHANVVALAAYSGPVGDVGKGPVVIVVVQAVVEVRTILGQTWESCSVGEEDIEVAIVIVVEQADPTRDTVDHRFIRKRAIIQNERNARLFLSVFELNVWRRLGKHSEG